MKPWSTLHKEKTQPPVKERTEPKGTAAVRFWRTKGRLLVKEDNGKKVLYLQGRRMLRSSEINKIDAEEFDRIKGSGAAKLACSLRHNFIRVSKEKVQKILK